MKKEKNKSKKVAAKIQKEKRRSVCSPKQNRTLTICGEKKFDKKRTQYFMGSVRHWSGVGRKATMLPN